MMTHVEPSRSVLSPRELARALGVSESSIKRWVDDGNLAATRTAGGHRRIALSEAVRFIRASGTPVLHPELLVGGRLPEAVSAALPARDGEAVSDALWQAIERDTPDTGRGLLVSLYVSGWSVAAICDGPIRSVLARVGSLWRHDASGIFMEHRATDTCLQSVAQIRALLPPPEPGSPIALGAAPGGDPYVLPTLMASVTAAEQGFAERNLGPDTPLATLCLAAEHYRPRLIWLAVSADRPPDEDTQAELAALAAVVAPWHGEVVVGGQLAPTLARPIPHLHRLGSMAELAAFAKGLRAGA